MKTVILAALLGVLPLGANAASIIDNGTIMLGVDNLGQLNIDGDVPSPVEGTTSVGLRYLPTGYEATSHACLCEGWGVGIGETGQSGFANNSSGIGGLTAVSFASTGSTATSIVSVDGTGLVVTHDFAPIAETSNLYRVRVTIENTAVADITDLRYTRTFDWDVEPTAFSEVVTHAGVATTPTVRAVGFNGFVSSDPFAQRPPLIDCTGDTVDCGPDDLGTNFDFGFGALLAGESFSFDIFYGATDTEAGALAALGEVSAELYSLGQSGSDPLGTGRDEQGRPTTTFIFGFAGIGGEVIIPDPTPTPSEVPLPASAFLLLGALGVLGAMRGRRKA